jgi:hypothetical protein
VQILRVLGTRWKTRAESEAILLAVLDVELMGMLLRLVRMMISMWQCKYLRSNGKQWKGGEDGTEEDDVLHPFPSEEFRLTSGRFLVVQSLRSGRSVAFKISSDDPTKF